MNEIERCASSWKPDVVWDDRDLWVGSSHSCFNGLSWDCRLRGIGMAAAVDAFKQRDWRDASRVASVVELQHTEGHTLVLLPSAQRVQLRVSYMVEAAQRRDRAARLAQEMAGAIRSLRNAAAVPA